MDPRIARRGLERLALAAALLMLALALERRTRAAWPPRPGRNGRLRRRPR